MAPASWMIRVVLLLAPAAGFWIGWRLGRAGPAASLRRAPDVARSGATAAGAARPGAGHEWLAYAQGGADAPIRDSPRPCGPDGTIAAAPEASGRTYLRAPR